MLITQLKSREAIEALATGKVFIINCHGCKEVRFPEEEAKALQKELQDAGVWIFGTAAGGSTRLWDADLKGACAIVIGSGITQVVATKRGSYSAHIGAGASGTSGMVTIDGVDGATTSSTFPHLTSVLTNSDKTWTLTPTNPNP